MRKRTTPERDWLYGQNDSAITFCRPTPPDPISGPLEGPHEPDEQLSDYLDERRWSDEIVAWSKEHALDSNLEFEVDEE